MSLCEGHECINAMKVLSRCRIAQGDSRSCIALQVKVTCFVFEIVKCISPEDVCILACLANEVK
jgi:hypothetical protein